MTTSPSSSCPTVDPALTLDISAPSSEQGDGSGLHAFSVAARGMQHVGYFGVDIFFVVSGFVISRLARLARLAGSGKAATPSSNVAATWTFVRGRALRIYPLFWVSLAAMLCVGKFPGADNSLATLWQDPASLLLFHNVPAHPVAWTLVYEVQFYAIAAAIILVSRGSPIAFLAWVGINILLVGAARLGFLKTFPLADALSLEFAAGILIGLVSDRVRLPLTATILFSFALVVVASICLTSDRINVTTQLRLCVWGVPATLLVWAFASAKQDALPFAKVLEPIGDISYSIYMWHLAVLASVGGLMVADMRHPAVAVLYVVLCLVLTGIISTASYKYLENPLRSRRR